MGDILHGLNFPKPLHIVLIESHFWGCLTKLHQEGTVDEFIAAFEQLLIHTNGFSNAFYTKCFISGLKPAIQAYVRMHHPPTWLAACERATKAEKIVNAQNICSSFTPCEHQFQPNLPTQPNW